MSRITYHHVTSWAHPAMSLKRDSRISASLLSIAKRDLELHGWSADNIVVAYRDGKVVGMFRYDLCLCRGRRLHAKGTVLIPSLRGRGIAARMWELAIKRVKPKAIDVHVVSKAGLRLVQKLRKSIAKVRWCVVSY